MRSRAVVVILAMGLVLSGCFRKPALTRADAPPSVVDLADGFVHYELSGPVLPDRPVVVLVHGASGSQFIWDSTFTSLTAAGFTVLRYDLYGRGFSERPNVRYDLDLFDRQLVGLLDALAIEGPVDIVGTSMGGMVAATFADRHPERIRRLVLIGPLGFPMVHHAGEGLLRVPLLGDVVFQAFGKRTLIRHNLAYLHEPANHPAFLPAYKRQFAFRGYLAAFLSTIRHVPLEDLSAVYGRVGASNVPVLLIWGREDRTVSFEQSTTARRLMPAAEFFPVERAAHLPQYERPDVVNPRLQEFLDR